MANTNEQATTNAYDVTTDPMLPPNDTNKSHKPTIHPANDANVSDGDGNEEETPTPSIDMSTKDAGEYLLKILNQKKV